jgi:hypothetical protein
VRALVDTRKRRVGIAKRPWIPWMGQREVGGVDSHALTLEQPLAKVLELASAMLTRKEYSMTVEALR